MSAPKESRVVYAVPRKFIIAWFVTLACMIGLTGAAIQYANHAVAQQNQLERESDRAWCDLIVFYTDYYRENAPQTELQKKQLALMEKRRNDLGCM
jgi:hypothetical protein